MGYLLELVKGIEWCFDNGALSVHGSYYDCRYCEYGNGRECAIKHALEELKKREPILLDNPHKPYGQDTNVNSPWISRCPKCGKKVEGKQTRYCKYCGQAVKWD